MKQRCSSSLNSIAIALLIAIAAMTANPAQVRANYDKAPIPLSSAVQLTNMTYSYDPLSNTLTKQYEFKNISGQTLLNPRLVNTFLWSNIFNNTCAVDWLTMGYDGTSTFLNVDQSAAVSGNDGTIDWSCSCLSLFPYFYRNFSLPSITICPEWHKLSILESYITME